MADILGTEVMKNALRTIDNCCFTMVKLPLAFNSLQSDEKNTTDQQRPSALVAEEGPELAKGIMHVLMTDHDTWIPCKFYNGAVWTRVSAQVYLDIEGFEWAAGILKQICQEVQQKWEQLKAQIP